MARRQSSPWPGTGSSNPSPSSGESSANLIARRAGWSAGPTLHLPITVAIFGLLVHLISFIPVIRQITRLADPYFVTNDRGDLQIGGFGARQVTERRVASSPLQRRILIKVVGSRRQSA